MLEGLKQVRAAFSLLNPEDIRGRAMRPVAIGLVATSSRGYRELEEFLAPPALPAEVREAALAGVCRAGDEDSAAQVDMVLYESGLPCPRGAFRHNRADPEITVSEILAAHEENSLALARRFPAFRKTVVAHIVQSVSRENALFAIATALPNIMPSMFELPWTFGEFASDTAFLTVNQVRMAFLIAAASGGEVGFGKQKLEILSIGAGAFGWRAIARELAGKIPLGAGLIPKGAIAYAATFLVGKGLERYHLGSAPYAANEQKALYQEGYQHGKALAESYSKNLS
ncbi:MAG: hypothetical protein JO099_15320 [Acidobacteriia bacterium]|nr:hypothetical protein [Terriglobia bacterium]